MYGMNFLYIIKCNKCQEYQLYTPVTLSFIECSNCLDEMEISKCDIKSFKNREELIEFIFNGLKKNKIITLTISEMLDKYRGRGHLDYYLKCLNLHLKELKDATKIKRNKNN